MSEKLADVRIDQEGDELLFRVNLGERLRRQFAWLFAPNKPAEAKPPSPADAALQALKANADALDDEIVRLYRDEGLSVLKVRRQLRISQQRAEAGLERKGVARRKPGRMAKPDASKPAKAPPPPIDTSHDAEIGRRYTEGESERDLEEAFKLNRAAIRAALARAGIPLRTRKEATQLYWCREREAGRAKKPAARTRPPASTAKPDVSTKPRRGGEQSAASVNSDPRSAGAPLRRQENAPPAIERLVEPERRTSKQDQDEEIERLYVVEELSSGEIARQFEIDPKTVRDALKRRNVVLRTASAAAQLAHKKREGNAINRRQVKAEPKLPPAAIPADAPKRTVKLADLRPPANPNAPKRKQRDVIEEVKAAGIKVTRQRKRSERHRLTPQAMQDAVSDYFAKGGVITEVVSEMTPDKSPLPVGFSQRANKATRRFT